MSPGGTCADGDRCFPEGVSNGGDAVAAGEKMMVQAMNDNHPLDGVRVLVVEDDVLMAMDLEDTLVQAGAIDCQVSARLWTGDGEGDDDDFAVAVLDFSLGAETASPLARRFVRRGVPFLFYTGDSAQGTELAGMEKLARSWKNRLRPSLVSAVRQFCRRAPVEPEVRG